MRLFVTITASACAYLALAAVALAGNPSVSGYGGDGGAVQANIQGGSSGEGGSLPLTGLDLGLLVGGGMLLLLVGGSLWRLTREKA